MGASIARARARAARRGRRGASSLPRSSAGRSTLGSRKEPSTRSRAPSAPPHAAQRVRRAQWFPKPTTADSSGRGEQRAARLSLGACASKQQSARPAGATLRGQGCVCRRGRSRWCGTRRAARARAARRSEAAAAAAAGRLWRQAGRARRARHRPRCLTSRRRTRAGPSLFRAPRRCVPTGALAARALARGCRPARSLFPPRAFFLRAAPSRPRPCARAPH